MSVLKCFLQVHQLFNKSDPRYILNQLYIQDYCVWIQKSNDETLASLAESLASVTFGFLGKKLVVTYMFTKFRWNSPKRVSIST